MSHTIFLLSLLAHLVLGTPVALLQESGIFNGQTYMARRDVDLSRGLKDFTVCAWISLNYLRGTNNYWLSIGNTGNEEILNGVFENGPDGPRIWMKKFHPKID